MTLLLATNARDINIDPLDWPRCGKCQMPVEQFRIVDTDDSITFVTECHGQEQIVQVPNDVFASMHGLHLSLGPAFVEETHE